jgi:hypothetical protein
MKNLKLALVAGLALLSSSCSLTRALKPHRPTPAEQVAAILAEHPELVAKPETVTVKVYYRVPEVHFEKELVPVYDTVYVQREASQLDTLVNQLQSRLDSAHLVAVRHQLHQLLTDRPVLRDTLRFDTLGVKGKIWRVGRNYRLTVTRAAIQDTARGKAAIKQLQVLPPVHLPFYNPAGWALPWYVWLLLGLVLGGLAGFRICYLLTRRANATSI